MLQSSTGGGGSGGNIYMHSESGYSLTGNLYCNGGSTTGNGGGGSGGRVHAFFQNGDFHTGFVEAIGRQTLLYLLFLQ